MLIHLPQCLAWICEFQYYDYDWNCMKLFFVKLFIHQLMEYCWIYYQWMRFGWKVLIISTIDHFGRVKVCDDFF
jgi:hypothetical protein